MATSRAAQSRQYLAELISTVIDPKRVVLGLQDFSPNFNFYANLATNGFYVLILPGKFAEWDPGGRHYKVYVEVRIYYSIPADEPNNWCAVEDMVTAIFNVCASSDSYNTPTGNPNGIPPPDVPFPVSEPHVDPNMKPLPAYTSFTLAFWANVDSASPIP